MMLFGRSVFTTLGLALALASLVACGGSHAEASAPKMASADVPAVGSTIPDPAPSTSPVVNPPASQTAAASKKDDGSDIIPPFPSAGGKKAATPTKAAKKVAKKKTAAATE